MINSIFKLIIITFLYGFKLICCQDTSKLTFDTIIHYTPSEYVYVFDIESSQFYSEFPVEISLSEEDSLFFKNHLSILNDYPTKDNYKLYFEFACSLWEIGNFKEAERLFLTIVKSKDKFYVNNYYNSSDIPGDTLSNLYGYGSFSSNYKNRSCIYLAKIYILNKQYKKALKFINKARYKYQVNYNCGTGNRNYKNRIIGLLGHIYFGLGQYNKVIELYLPNCFDTYSKVITKAIKMKYSKKQINKILLNAEKSIECIIDTLQITNIIEQLDTNNNGIISESEIEVYSAKIKILGKIVNMTDENNEKGKIITRSLFIDSFRKSGFYKSLITDN